ncbi:nucleotidyltransferase family protein [Thermodesulfobacteriota bacterium]
MPTALELKHKGWQPYIDALSRRPSASQLSPQQEQERKTILMRVQQAAVMLKSRYNVQRVVLFGSLAHESWFRSGSDVDLAVEGLRSKDYWQAWRDVEAIIGDKSVDFIEMETAGESLRRTIDRQGMDI